MKKIKEYKINVVGDTQGIEGAIPANHRVCVTEAHIYHDSIGDVWKMTMTVCTFKDGNYDQLVTNDNFPNNSAIVELGADVPATGLKTTVKNQMNLLLDGFANVGSGNYTEDPV